MNTTLTPKMQLSQDCPVTPAFRAEINAWMIDFFGYVATPEEAPQPQPPACVYHEANTTVQPKPKRELRKQRSRTQAIPDTATFSALLEGLEDTFHTMRVPDIKGSWLTKREVTSIKKMGVYVPSDLAIENYDHPTLPVGTNLPAIATAFLVPRKEDTEDKYYPRFIFALKGAALPPGVEPVRGTPFQYGMCFEAARTEAGKPAPPRVFWMYCWLVVKPDGEIVIPHEHRQFPTKITHRHSKRNKGCKTATVHNRRWTVPSMAAAETGIDQAGHVQFLRLAFRQLIVWWAARSTQWSVGVRKDGNRATFSIAPEHTAAYFADRNTVVNANGKPKKIIHFVRPHTRSTGASVKAHVRGVREFDWKGYHCAVTAPKLNGAIFTQCELAPVLLEKEELNEDFMETVEFAIKLADAEDGKGLTI